MYNVAASLVKSPGKKAPVFVLSATKKGSSSKKHTVSPEEPMATMNYWGQGVHKDDLNFYEADVCSFLKVIK